MRKFIFLECIVNYLDVKHRSIFSLTTDKNIEDMYLENKFMSEYNQNESLCWKYLDKSPYADWLEVDIESFKNTDNGQYELTLTELDYTWTLDNPEFWNDSHKTVKLVKKDILRDMLYISILFMAFVFSDFCIYSRPYNKIEIIYEYANDILLVLYYRFKMSGLGISLEKHSGLFDLSKCSE